MAKMKFIPLENGPLKLEVGGTEPRIIEKLVYVDRPVEVLKEVLKEVQVEKLVYVDRPVEVIKEVEKIREVEKRIEVPVEVIREVEKHIIKEVPVIQKEIVKMPPEINEITHLVFKYKAPKWAWVVLGLAIVEMLVILAS